MKRIFYLFLMGCFSLLFFASCEPDTPTEFDKNLLIGKWSRQSDLTDGLDCYRYDNDGTGVTWDTGDGTTEKEGQAFEWKLEQADLTHIHVMEINGQASVPKVYQVTELTSIKLSYKDDYGKIFSFSKMN